jgi:hypothetical protein
MNSSNDGHFWEGAASRLKLQNRCIYKKRSYVYNSGVFDKIFMLLRKV